MDNCGVSPTNDPSIHVLWEQHGRTVTMALVSSEEPSVAPCLRLPSAPEPE
ncbi:hypothetical protein ACFWWC_03635 [Streptomyces sp. NPDC058642]|uniref:hypothetical protein n=1 Tax=Streptomyces sp. NPDC058642 TaxID=3346572 RepID=UPI00364EF8B7